MTYHAVVIMMLISGCSGSQLKDERKIPKPDQDQSLILLQKSASSIEQSLTQLAEAEQFEKMKLRPNEPRIYKQVPGMEGIITMPWHGTLEQAVSKLASFSGYQVKFMGKPPVIPIIVQIGGDPATVSDHLRNIGIQSGNRADIIISVLQKVVEVRYANGV